MRTGGTLPEIFARLLVDDEFDVAELGMTFHLRALDRGRDDFVALPLFPNRVFRHSCIYVNVERGIEHPADLAGKAIGEFGIYSQDSGVWAKGMLMDEYGFDPAANRWVIGGLEPVERDWHRRTGIFPMMHTVVVRRRLLERQPEVVRAVYDGFVAAKEHTAERYRRMRRLFEVQSMLPWANALEERNHADFGEDWWPYGVAANRSALEANLRYQHEQGLVDRPWAVDEFFAADYLST